MPQATRKAWPAGATYARPLFAGQLKKGNAVAVGKGDVVKVEEVEVKDGGIDEL